jgi:multiple sugar transport system permease protein
VRDRRLWLWLILPALLTLGPLVLYPLGRMAALSLHDSEYGFEGARWVGLANYAELWGDRFFRRATWNTVVFTLAATTLEVAAGLGLALLFHRPFPGRGGLTLALAAPYALSTMVVTAIWRAWFNSDVGYLNVAARSLGLAPVPWLTSPDVALWSIVLADVWQTAPFAFLIILAGLRMIPGAIYEAARIDGAGPFRTFRDHTLPLLAPYLAAAALLRSIDSFKLFDKVYAMTGGGPGLATETLSLFVFRSAFRWFDAGKAAAGAMVMAAVAALLAALYARALMRGRR